MRIYSMRVLKKKQITFPSSIRSLLDSFYTSQADEWPVPVAEGVRLLTRMLDPNPDTRISSAEALQHPFLLLPDSAFDGTDLTSYQEKFPKRITAVYKSRRNKIVVHYR